jgi:hypothetical protein
MGDIYDADPIIALGVGAYGGETVNLYALIITVCTNVFDEPCTDGDHAEMVLMPYCTN